MTSRIAKFTAPALLILPMMADARSITVESCVATIGRFCPVETVGFMIFAALFFGVVSLAIGMMTTGAKRLSVNSPQGGHPLQSVVSLQERAERSFGQPVKPAVHELKAPIEVTPRQMLDLMAAQLAKHRTETATQPEPPPSPDCHAHGFTVTMRDRI